MTASTGNQHNPSPAEGIAQGWATALAQFQKDARLWLVIFSTLWMFRWLMIFLFRDQTAEAFTANDLLKCAIAGGRFDSVVATYWILPCVLFSIVAGIWGRVRMAERARLKGVSSNNRQCRVDGGGAWW